MILFGHYHIGCFARCGNSVGIRMPDTEVMPRLFKRILSVCLRLYFARSDVHSKAESSTISAGEKITGDLLLAEAINRGDEQAFKQFYEQTSFRIFNYLLMLSKDKGIAQECMQDTYIAVWNNRHTFSEVKFPRAYLAKIAGRIFFKYKQRKNQAVTLNEADYSELISEANGYLDVDMRDFFAQLRGAIERLPEQQGKVFQLIVVDGLSYREVSKLLKISESAVSNYMEFARKKIKSEIFLHDYINH